MPRLANESHVWVNSPISGLIGEISMAGVLHDSATIPIDRMRILGKHALVLVLGGNGFYSDANGHQRSLRGGDAIRVNAHLPHAYGSADGRAWGQAYVVFDGPQFDLLERAIPFSSSGPIWHLEPVEFWRQRLEEIFLPSAPKSELEALHTIGRFASLLVEMCATDATARKHPDEAWLQTSMHLLGEPQGGHWTRPQEVAFQVGLSYENFRKRFSARTGHPPSRYQLQRRIDLACAAIYRGADNFKELAEELGFCDIYHFSKVFRQHVGEPPSNYRRRVRGG